MPGPGTSRMLRTETTLEDFRASLTNPRRALENSGVKRLPWRTRMMLLSSAPNCSKYSSSRAKSSSLCLKISRGSSSKRSFVRPVSATMERSPARIAKAFRCPSRKQPYHSEKWKRCDFSSGLASSSFNRWADLNPALRICRPLTQVAGAMRCNRMEKRKQERGMRASEGA